MQQSSQQAKKDRFRVNIRSLLAAKGWTAKVASEELGIPVKWLQRVSQSGLARRQAANDPYLKAILKAFKFRSTDPGVLWSPRMVMPRQTNYDGEFEKTVEYLRWIYDHRPRRTVRRIARIIEKVAAPDEDNDRSERKKPSKNRSGEEDKKPSSKRHDKKPKKKYGGERSAMYHHQHASILKEWEFDSERQEAEEDWAAVREQEDRQRHRLDQIFDLLEHLAPNIPHHKEVRDFIDEIMTTSGDNERIVRAVVQAFGRKR